MVEKWEVFLRGTIFSRPHLRSERLTPDKPLGLNLNGEQFGASR